MTKTSHEVALPNYFRCMNTVELVPGFRTVRGTNENRCPLDVPPLHLRKKGSVQQSHHAWELAISCPFRICLWITRAAVGLHSVSATSSAKATRSKYSAVRPKLIIMNKTLVVSVGLFIIISRLSTCQLGYAFRHLQVNRSSVKLP